MSSAIEETSGYKEQIRAKEKVIKELKEKSWELEELKKRDIDRVEKERDEFNGSLDKLQVDYDKILKEKEEIDDALMELEITKESEKKATMQVSEEFRKKDRVKKGGKDSILSVDDEDDITNAFSRLLGRKYNVYTANSGQKALEVLEANPDICLVVTDQRMPGMTGLEFAAEARKKYEGLPVYLLTGYTDLNVAIEAMNTGAIIKYFEKPVDWEKLEVEIDSGIEQFDIAVAQKEILEEKKFFVVDKIKEISISLETLKYNNAKLTEESGSLKSKNEQMVKNIDKLTTEINELRISVAKERKDMLKEMAGERKALEEEIARKKDEAERVVETQKEKNREELERVQKEFAAEKKNVAEDI